MKDIKSRNHQNRSPAAPASVRPMKLWQDDSKHQEIRVEIVPLIDVIFCILTFFMLAAVGMSRQQAITLDLPRANTGKPQMREMLIVSLNDFGQTYVEQQLVSGEQLQQTLANYQKINPNGLIVLYATQNTSYSEVVRVLDTLRQVGGDRVALATLPAAEVSVDSPKPKTIDPQPNSKSPALLGVPSPPGENRNSLPELKK